MLGTGHSLAVDASDAEAEFQNAVGVGSSDVSFCQCNAMAQGGEQFLGGEMQVLVEELEARLLLGSLCMDGSERIHEQAFQFGFLLRFPHAEKGRNTRCNA